MNWLLEETIYHAPELFIGSVMALFLFLAAYLIFRSIKSSRAYEAHHQLHESVEEFNDLVERLLV